MELKTLLYLTSIVVIKGLTFVMLSLKHSIVFIALSFTYLNKWYIWTSYCCIKKNPKFKRKTKSHQNPKQKQQKSQTTTPLPIMMILRGMQRAKTKMSWSTVITELSKLGAWDLKLRTTLSVDYRALSRFCLTTYLGLDLRWAPSTHFTFSFLLLLLSVWILVSKEGKHRYEGGRKL